MYAFTNLHTNGYSSIISIPKIFIGHVHVCQLIKSPKELENLKMAEATKCVNQMNVKIRSTFGDISFQEYVTKGISHPVFYGDLVYKLRKVKDTPNFISSGSKIVKRLRRRQYDTSIIERTIGLVLGSLTAMYRPFLKHLTNKAVGTI